MYMHVYIEYPHLPITEKPSVHGHYYCKDNYNYYNECLGE